MQSWDWDSLRTRVGIEIFLRCRDGIGIVLRSIVGLG